MKGKNKRKIEKKTMKEAKVKTGYKGSISPRHAGMVFGKLARTTRASTTTSLQKELKTKKKNVVLLLKGTDDLVTANADKVFVIFNVFA